MRRTQRLRAGLILVSPFGLGLDSGEVNTDGRASFALRDWAKFLVLRALVLAWGVSSLKGLGANFVRLPSAHALG